MDALGIRIGHHPAHGTRMISPEGLDIASTVDRRRTRQSDMTLKTGKGVVHALDRENFQSDRQDIIVRQGLGREAYALSSDDDCSEGTMRLRRLSRMMPQVSGQECAWVWERDNPAMCGSSRSSGPDQTQVCPKDKYRPKRPNITGINNRCGFQSCLSFSKT